MPIAGQYFLSQVAISFHLRHAISIKQALPLLSPFAIALQVNNSWASQQFAISPPHFPFAMQRFAILPIKLPEQQMSSAPPPPPSWSCSFKWPTAADKGQCNKPNPEFESKIQNPNYNSIRPIRLTHRLAQTRRTESVENLIEHSKTHWHVRQPALLRWSGPKMQAVSGIGYPVGEWERS